LVKFETVGADALVGRSVATMALASIVSLPKRASGAYVDPGFVEYFIGGREPPMHEQATRLRRQRIEEATRVAFREWRFESLHRV